jgi:MFS family permease
MLVNWTGKLVGCVVFEPLIEWLGFKKIIYVLAIIQIVAVAGTFTLLPNPAIVLPTFEHFFCILPHENDLTTSVELSASSWIQFCIGRVLAYVAVGIVEPTIPIYQAELAPAPLRGFFAGNVQVLLHLGSIWGAGMSRAYANETDRKGWMIPVSIQMIPAVVLLMGVPFCIESPRWLIAHDRKVSLWYKCPATG